METKQLYRKTRAKYYRKEKNRSIEKRESGVENGEEHSIVKGGKEII